MTLHDRFEAEPRYGPGMAPITAGGEGELIGGGDGSMHGEALTGTLRRRAAPVPASFTRPDDWRARREQLEPAERALYREILVAFARGERPTAAALAAHARELDVDLAAALGRFEKLDLVRTEASSGQVVVAYPFSGRPTAHRLELAGDREAYAMCAVDALGVAAMLGSRVLVRSIDPVSNEEIVVDVSPDGVAHWAPAEAVVFVGGREGGEAVAELCCPAVNFFASPETARAYQRARPDLAGNVVSIDEAVAGGRAIFAEALR